MTDRLSCLACSASPTNMNRTGQRLRARPGCRVELDMLAARGCRLRPTGLKLDRAVAAAAQKHQLEASDNTQTSKVFNDDVEAAFSDLDTNTELKQSTSRRWSSLAAIDGKGQRLEHQPGTVLGSAVLIAGTTIGAGVRLVSAPASGSPVLCNSKDNNVGLSLEHPVSRGNAHVGNIKCLRKVPTALRNINVSAGSSSPGCHTRAHFHLEMATSACVLWVTPHASRSFRRTDERAGVDKPSLNATFKLVHERAQIQLCRMQASCHLARRSSPFMLSLLCRG